MSMSRAIRNLVFVAILGISPVLNAGDLRNLPLDARRVYFDFIVLAYGLSSVSNTFLYYFGSKDSAPAVSSDQTDIINALYIAETSSREVEPNIYEMDIVQESIIITTSDEIDIEISQQEFIELQDFSPVLADAMRAAENQYRMRLQVSTALLKLFLRLTREIGKGRPIFSDYSLEELVAIKLEADRLKGRSLITLINSFNRDQYRPFRAPHVMPVCPSIPQSSPNNDAILRHFSVDSIPPKARKRAESNPHVNLCLHAGVNKKKDKSHQNICLPASPRETPPNTVTNERRKSQLKTATWVRLVSTEPAQMVTTESTTTASSTTVNTNAPQLPVVRVVEWSNDPGYQEGKTLTIATIDTQDAASQSGVKKTTSEPFTIENLTMNGSPRASSPRSKYRRKNTVDPSTTNSEMATSTSEVKKTNSEPLTTDASSTTISVKTTSRRSRRTRETAEPSTTEASSTTTTTTTSADSSTIEEATSLSNLWQLVEWTQDPEFQPIVCFYYPYKLSDTALANLLPKLDLNREKDRTFALSLISCFAAQGFSHRLDDTLINAINLILQKLSNLHLAQFLQRLDLTQTESSRFAASLLKCFAHHKFPNDAIGSVIHALESTLTVGDTLLTMAFHAQLSHADSHAFHIEQIETAALSQKHWRDYKDSEIVEAWTYSEALLSRYLPPLIETGSCKPKMDNKISPLTDSYNKFVNWIILEVKPSIDESKIAGGDIGLTKEELKLTKEELKRAVRFLKIADQMIKIDNFHTAFTIFTALNKATFLDQATPDDNKNLYDVFSVSVNFAKYRRSVEALRSKGSPYLFISNFYGKDFAPLEQNFEGYKDRLEQEGDLEKISAYEKQSALDIGKFFQQMHEHQVAAHYECTAPKGLVSFFINIAKR